MWNVLWKWIITFYNLKFSCINKVNYCASTQNSSHWKLGNLVKLIDKAHEGWIGWFLFTERVACGVERLLWRRVGWEEKKMAVISLISFASILSQNEWNISGLSAKKQSLGQQSPEFMNYSELIADFLCVLLVKMNFLLWLTANILKFAKLIQDLCTLNVLKSKKKKRSQTKNKD